MAPRHVQVLKASRVVEPTWAQRDPFDVFGDFSPPDHPPSPGGYPIWGLGLLELIQLRFE